MQGSFVRAYIIDHDVCFGAQFVQPWWWEKKKNKGDGSFKRLSCDATDNLIMRSVFIDGPT